MNSQKLTFLDEIVDKFIYLLLAINFSGEDGAVPERRKRELRKRRRSDPTSPLNATIYPRRSDGVDRRANLQHFYVFNASHLIMQLQVRHKSCSLANLTTSVLDPDPGGFGNLDKVGSRTR